MCIRGGCWGAGVVVIVGVDDDTVTVAGLPFEFYEFLRKLQNANGERKAKGAKPERHNGKRRLNTSKSEKTETRNTIKS